MIFFKLIVTNLQLQHVVFITAGVAQRGIVALSGIEPLAAEGGQSLLLVAIDNGKPPVYTHRGRRCLLHSLIVIVVPTLTRLP
jgi:hypothetical protein